MTLEEVGRLAGVSRSTVSRVINGRDDVSPEARDRVLEVVAQTGFSPNRAARSLVSRRTQLLGLVFNAGVAGLFSDPYYSAMVEELAAAAHDVDETLALFVFDEGLGQEDVYLRAIRSGLVDGAIIATADIGSPLGARLKADTLPFVVIGRPEDPGLPFVDVDNVGGARDAAEHLLGHGYERIGMVGGPLRTTTGVDRRAGFLGALEAAGREPEPALFAEGDFTVQGGYEATRLLLDARPDAIFCASDMMARGAHRALREAGLSCPDDVALFGYDGLLDLGHDAPGLSTIAQPIAATASAAVGVLHRIIEGGRSAAEAVVLPTTPLIRSSCGCDPEGGEAPT